MESKLSINYEKKQTIQTIHVRFFYEKNSFNY